MNLLWPAIKEDCLRWQRWWLQNELNIPLGDNPENTRSWTNVFSIVDQHPRRWANIGTAIVWLLMSAEKDTILDRILYCKVKMQYRLTCKASQYCLLVLHDRVDFDIWAIFFPFSVEKIDPGENGAILVLTNIYVSNDKTFRMLSIITWENVRLSYSIVDLLTLYTQWDWVQLLRDNKLLSTKLD